MGIISSNSELGLTDVNLSRASPKGLLKGFTFGRPVVLKPNGDSVGVVGTELNLLTIIRICCT